MRARWLTFVIVVASSAILSSASMPQQTAAQLYQSGVYAEEIEGNLQKAIGVFEQVIKQFPGDRDTAANAQLHIGLCYERMGLEKAREAYEKVIRNYPGQGAAVAVAREKLDAILRLTSASRKGDPEVTVRRVPTPGGTADVAAVSPDGKYLANFAASVKDCDLWISDTSTGQQRFLTTEGKEKGCKEVARSPRWSRDSTKLAYAWGYPPAAQLRVVALDGSPPRVLVPKAGGYWIDALDWSADGSTILAVVLHNDRQELVLVSVTDGSVRSLRTFIDVFGPIDSHGRFSPDGAYVAYSRPVGKGGNSGRLRDIFVLSVAGGPENALVQHPADDVLLDWLPGERGVLFVSDRAGTTDVWSLSVEKGQPQGVPELVRRSIGPITPLGLTSNGALYYKTFGASKDIYTVKIDPDTAKIAGPPKKEPLPWEGHNEYPAWSPDGRRLAYVSIRPAIRAEEFVVCVHSAGTGSVREYRNERVFHTPRWSRDGRYLYLSASNLDGRGVYRLDVDSGEVTPFLGTGEAQGTMYLQVSADGKWLVYGRGSRQVVRRDTKTGEEKEVDRSASYLGGVALSPDDSRLAWVVRPDKTTVVLKVMAFPDGTPMEIQRLTQTTAPAEVAWSPDGRFIYYTDVVPGTGRDWHLWRIPAEGGTPQDVGLGVRTFDQFSVHPDGSRITIAAPTVNPIAGEVRAWENFLPARK